MSTHHAVLLLGSNIGDQKKNIETAFALMEEQRIFVLNKSELTYTEPVEFASTNIFCNIASRIEAQLSPFQLLKTLKNIEKKMGREADSAILGRYADRIIDIDIVYYDNIRFNSRLLKIPHYKHIAEREFSKKLLEQIGF